MEQNRLKFTIMQTLLQESFPSVVVDTNYPGVEIPDFARTGPAMLFRLKFEHGAQIPDLKLTEAYWQGTLTRAGQAYYVKVPWGACVEFCGNPENNTFRVTFLHAPAETSVKANSPEKAPAEVRRLPPRFGVIKGDKA